jgi:hypothetical protein
MGLFDITGIGPVADLAKEILAMFPNAEQRALAANKLQDLAAQISAAQSATNTEEAKSDNWFVAGWRPACGWVCLVGLLYSSVISPAFGSAPADTNTLIGILSGMLGLGGMRTAEKITAIKRK